MSLLLFVAKPLFAEQTIICRPLTYICRSHSALLAFEKDEKMHRMIIKIGICTGHVSQQRFAKNGGAHSLTTDGLLTTFLYIINLVIKLN